MKTRRICSSMWVSSGRCRGFTLIELLVVVAIIALLIGILMPSLSAARDSAKRVKTRAIIKSMGDGLEAFASELPKELKGNAYPMSTPDFDRTQSGGSAGSMYGAQFVVRYLMGKDGRGYVPPSSVPKRLWHGEAGYEYKGWYSMPGDADWWFPDGVTEGTFSRAGPYLAPDGARTMRLMDITTASLDGPAIPGDETDPLFNNPLIVDPYNMPILYYAAESKYAQRTTANIATGSFRTGFNGIYRFGDNAVFTGGCPCNRTEEGCACLANNGILDLSGTGKLGPLSWPTEWEGEDPPEWRTTDEEDGVTMYPDSFAYYIMNKEVFESTDGKSVVPYRKDSFILVSPGKDGWFGTRDDVTNFN